MDNMKLNNVELQIVEFMFEHEKVYLPSQSIAEFIEVSDKTVRKYIKSLNGVLEDFGANIEMKRGSGYQLVVKDNKRFYQLLERIKTQKHSMEDSMFLIDSTDRERFILNALLLENKLMTLDELADLMFISKSTISAVVQLIRERIKRFSLSIAYDLDGHVMIKGEEIEKRRFILNYFFSTSSLGSNTNADLLDYQYKGFSTETIFIIVLEKCREFNIQLSDFVLQNLVLHIALAIKRNEKGFTINNVQVDDAIEYDKELFVAEKIVASIEKLIEIQFTENEAKYIALHLKSKSNNQVQILNKQDDPELSLKTQITETLGQMQSQSDVYFSMDHQLMMGLKTHFEPLMTRLKLGIKLKNPLLDEIKDKYADVFDTTKTYFMRMPLLKTYVVDDHEWAYISLHVLAAVERYKKEHKVNVIVICATGLGSAQMLKNRLENEFAGNLNIIDVISYYQLNDEVLKNVDLIVSTLDISTSFYSIPVIKVSVFLNKQDIELLNQHLTHFISRKEETTESRENTDLVKELFKRYFNKARFIVFEETNTRENVLEQLIETLTDIQQTSFQEDLKNQIQIREQFGTLAFTDNVAFPHPAQPVGINSEIVVGVVPAGLAWDSEHPAVKMVVLMSPSKIENKGLDIINSGLAEFIMDEANIQALVDQPSFSQFQYLFMEQVTE